MLKYTKYFHLGDQSQIRHIGELTLEGTEVLEGSTNLCIQLNTHQTQVGFGERGEYRI